MISVCIATYNGEKYLRKQLTSILSQLGEHDEVVISDDSSNDKTLEIIDSIKDSRVRIVKSQTSRSPIYNFENALQAALGDVIVLADQDDEWKEGRISAALKALESTGLVICDAEVIDGAGEPVGQSLYGIYNSRPGLVKSLLRNTYVGCCMAFRREVLEIALPFPKNLPMHDWWLGLIADAFFSTRFLKLSFVRYRRHGNNASTTGAKSSLRLSLRLYHRWIMVRALTSRGMKVRHRRPTTTLLSN